MCIKVIFSIKGHQGAQSAGAAVMSWQSFLHRWSVWVRSVCYCQLVNVLCRGSNLPVCLLMLPPQPGNAEVTLYWLTAMKGHVSRQALRPLVARGSRETISGWWLVWNCFFFKSVCPPNINSFRLQRKVEGELLHLDIYKKIYLVFMCTWKH